LIVKRSFEKTGLAEVEYEVCSLLIWNRGVRIIGIFAIIEVYDEPLVFGPILIFLQCLFQPEASSDDTQRELERRNYSLLIANDVTETAMRRSMEFLLEDSFDVVCPALI
jgi:hypothetical protein